MAINWNKYKTYDRQQEAAGNPNQWKESFQQRMSGKEARRIMEKTKETPYSVLGLSQTPEPTYTEIKAAYRAAVMEWHPDRNQHRIDEATEQMKKINAAYTILTEKS